MSVIFPLDHRTALLQGPSQVIIPDSLGLSLWLSVGLLPITAILFLLDTTFQIFDALVLALVELLLVSVPAFFVDTIKQIDARDEGTSDGGS